MLHRIQFAPALLLAGSLLLAACGGGAAPASSAPTSPPAAPSSAAAKPAASAAAPAKPAASASAKPAASGAASAKPAASGAAASSGAAGSLKVALLTSGPVNDGGWNQLAYEGLQKMKSDLNLQVANSEDVKESDQLSLMRNYVNQGFNVIIGHGFEYQKALEQAAKDNPKTQFVQIGGIGANGTNLQSYVWNVGEGGWVAGALAAATTKNNHIAVVGALDIPTIAGDFTSFEQSIKQYNPQAKVDKPIYSGSFDDIAKGKAAGTTALSSGADVILANGDAVNVGTVQAAKGKQVRIIGWTKDQTSLDPAVVEASYLNRVDKAMEDAVKSIQGGKPDGKNHAVGIKDGDAGMAFNDKLVPADVQAKVKAVQDDVASGKIKLPELKS